jgi:hypothetical protein
LSTGNVPQHRDEDVEAGATIGIERLSAEVLLWLADASPDDIGGGLVLPHWIVRRAGDGRLTHVYPLAATDPADLVERARRLAPTWRARFVASAQLVAAAAVLADGEGMPQ